MRPEFARFCIAFMDDGMLDGKQVLSKFVIEKLSAPHVPVPNDDRRYGYGLSVRDEGGLRWLSHTGNRTGYGSQARMCPEKKFAVIILCNKTGANLMRVADQAVELASVSSRCLSRRASVSRCPLKKWRVAGAYSAGRNTLMLRVREGRLVGAAGRYGDEVGEHRYVRAAASVSPELEFTLVRDAASMVTHLISKGRVEEGEVNPAWA